MARIIFPESFLDQSQLFILIRAKHAADGAGSPLTAYLAQQGINFTDDEAARVAAAAFEKMRQEQAAKSEDHREKRDLLFNPVMGRVRKYYQFLKKFYAPNTAVLGEWGAPITVTGRIAYPAEYVALTEMVETLITKHSGYPAGTSPLDPYLTQHELSIADDETAAGDSLDEHDLFKQFASDSEDDTEDRNLVWNPVMEHIRDIAGFLMALYNDNPKQLGYWGFTVDHSPRAPKVVTSKVKLLDQVTVNGVIIGGTLKNIGTVPLTVYKGKTATGAGTVVPPGEMLGIAKGYSIITVVNPSSTIGGVFTALRGR